MHQNAPGLQFLKPGGRTWLDAPVKKEEFVVNLGQSWPPSSKKTGPNSTVPQGLQTQHCE